MKDIALKEQLEQVKAQSPLTLVITNVVTVNECANALLAAGASPVMSADPDDAHALAGLAAATVLNTGTINNEVLKVALAAGQGAREAGRPLVLDPVGVGATAVRKRANETIIKELTPDIIRGNFSEITTLAGQQSTQKGVDSSEAENLPQTINLAKNLALEYKCVVAVTGAVDVISDGQSTYTLGGGSYLLPRITGSGCLLTALVGAYAGANPHTLLQATVAALAHLALAGERAAAQLTTPGALGSFRVALFDHLALINADDLAEAKLKAVDPVQPPAELVKNYFGKD